MDASCAAPQAARRKRLSGAGARRSRSRDPPRSGVCSSRLLAGSALRAHPGDYLHSLTGPSATRPNGHRPSASCEIGRSDRRRTATQRRPRFRSSGYRARTPAPQARVLQALRLNPSLPASSSRTSAVEARSAARWPADPPGHRQHGVTCDQRPVALPEKGDVAR